MSHCAFRQQFAALALALPLVILAWVLPAHGEIHVDQVGRRVEISAAPQRIVSLMPSLTEMVFALGAGERIKGVTLYSNEPPAAAELPRVGSYVRLDLEKILSLKPDLCLAVRDGNSKQTVERLTALGIAVFTIDPHSLEEIMEAYRLLGAILDARHEAEAICRKMTQRIKEVEALVAHSPTKPRVFFQIDASPVISAGSGTFIDQMILRAGGINLAAGATPYPRFSWEDILLMQPEIVIIASMAGGFSEEELKAGWSRWPHIPAVRDNRLHVVGADLFDRPTARLADGLHTLARIFHPRLVENKLGKERP